MKTTTRIWPLLLVGFALVGCSSEPNTPPSVSNAPAVAPAGEPVDTTKPGALKTGPGKSSLKGGAATIE